MSAQRSPGRARRLTRRGDRSLGLGLGPGAWIALAVIALIVISALAPGLLAPGDPLAVHPSEAFRPPSPAHPFGTDEVGRDTWLRVIHGAGPSLIIGISATLIGLALALVLGLAAALGPRWLDFGVNRLLEVLFALPGLVLALLLITAFGPGVVTSTIAVGLATAPGYARMIRTQTVRIARSGYVEAERVLGRSPWRVLTRRVLPNLVVPLFVIATLGVGQAVVWASSLSYLGLGVAPPAAEWGAMLNAGRTYLATSAWWLTFFPGTAIVATAVATTVLSRAIAERSRRA